MARGFTGQRLRYQDLIAGGPAYGHLAAKEQSQQHHGQCEQDVDGDSKE